MRLCSPGLYLSFRILSDSVASKLTEIRKTQVLTCLITLSDLEGTRIRDDPNGPVTLSLPDANGITTVTYGRPPTSREYQRDEVKVWPIVFASLANPDPNPDQPIRDMIT